MKQKINYWDSSLCVINLSNIQALLFNDIPLKLKLTDHIRQDEVPARYEGPYFSHRHVAVEVRRARLGDAGAELGVAQAGQHGGQGRDEEAEDNGWSRLLSSDLACEDVDTGAQRGAHAQGDEVQSGQAAGELRLFVGEVQRPATQQGFAEIGQNVGHAGCDQAWVQEKALLFK